MLQANLVGRVRKTQVHCKRFFQSPTMDGHQDSCDLIWKIAFRSVEKIGGDIFKANSLQSK